ncbi:MAG: hypothetical protein J6V44_03475 [Methanobrevibacter sp.]|nr:hypothetical protein [Methanobrevibacter sp.]
MKKRLILQINYEIIETLEKEKTEKWLKENIPKYDRSIDIRPQKFQKKRTYRPRVSSETYFELQNIPGSSNTQKLVNLYYNVKRQNEKKENREKILGDLFPNHPYLKKE